jgi:hypothetical protein
MIMLIVALIVLVGVLAGAPLARRERARRAAVEALVDRTRLVIMLDADRVACESSG